MSGGKKHPMTLRVTQCEAEIAESLGDMLEDLRVSGILTKGVKIGLRIREIEGSKPETWDISVVMSVDAEPC